MPVHPRLTALVQDRQVWILVWKGSTSVDPLNGNNRLQLVQFDSSVLSSYYSNGVSLGQGLLAKKIDNELLAGLADIDPSVIPPWQLRDSTSGADALQRIYSYSKFIDEDDPRVTAHGDDETFKNLFSLYVGLTKMREIASFVESGQAQSSQLTLLQNKLNNGLAETKNFVSKMDQTEVSLLFGLKNDTAISSLELPALLEDGIPYHKGAHITDVRDDPVAGLTGTETFDITIDTASTSKVVSIDLSAVSGTLNVDNIASHINSQLLAAGVSTSIAVQRNDEFSYSFDLKIGGGETATFGNATGTSGAVYIAGANGVGDGSSGFLKKLDDLAAGAPNEVFRSDIDTTEAADKANAVAVDSQGYVYTVGTTAGDLEGQINQGERDAFLNKYDGAGNLVFSRLLGATDDASGFSIAIDDSDNVVIAGSARGQLTTTAYGGGYDSFVTKFDSDGNEQFTRQASPYADDEALAVSTDASGNIFIAGFARGAVDSTATHQGGSDAYVTKLDSTGTLLYSKQFGDTGDDRATAIAVDNAGSFFVASEVNGNAIVRKYTDEASSQTPVWEHDLGSLGSDGEITGLSLGSAGNVFVSGSTDNGALAGSVAQAHSGGGRDGFVAQITDAGASASAGFVSYVGSTGDDTIKGLAVDAATDDIYVTGGTTGGIDGGGSANSQDYFAAKLDGTGASQFTTQFRGTFNHAGNGIAFDSDGTSVLSRLGLPTGTVPVGPPTETTSLTSARVGQSFTLSVNGETATTIEIKEGDSLTYLALKAKQALGIYGSVTVEDEVGHRTLQIEAKNGGVIEIGGGPDGFNALPSLGLTPGTIYGEPAEGEEEDQSIFELGIFEDMSVLTQQGAVDAGTLIDNALREIRDAFQYVTVGPQDESRETGPVSLKQADSERIANLQAVLQTVTSIASSFAQTNASSNNGNGNGNSFSSSSLYNLLI